MGNSSKSYEEINEIVITRQEQHFIFRWERGKESDVLDHIASLVIDTDCPIEFLDAIELIAYIRWGITF